MANPFGRPPLKACSRCGKPWSDVVQRIRMGLGWCRKCVNEEKAERRRGYTAKGLCFNCGSRPHMATQILCKVCREKLDVRRKRFRTDEKLACFSAYGGAVCACCGETEVEFLSIDHINNDGAEHRRKLRRDDWMFIYTWLRKNNYPDGFQVLCMNCNWAKGKLGYCPHRPPS